MQNKQHLGFWMAAAGLAFFLGPIFRTGDAMLDFADAEVRQTQEAMGQTLGHAMIRVADTLFEQTPVSAGAMTLRKVKLSRAEQQLSQAVAGPIGEISSKVFNSYLQGIVLQAYVLTIRLAILVFWGVFLLPMLAATVFDGIMQRSVKRAEFGSLRPATFTLAGVLVIPMLSLPLLYLTMPFSLSPLLAPMWAAVVALPLSVLISNSQPLFGR